MRPALPLAALAVAALLAPPALASVGALPGDYLWFEETGPNLITRPDGQVAIATVGLELHPLGIEAQEPLPSSIAWCLLGFPTPCGPRYDIPQATAVDGVWQAQITSDYPAAPYFLAWRLGGWNGRSERLDCAFGQTEQWTLNWNARTAQGACATLPAA